MARKISFTLVLAILLVSGYFLVSFLLDSKIKSGLQVITNDKPCSLFLDGQFLNKTPYINKTIKPGTYNLRIQPEDNSFSVYETLVTMYKGSLTVVTWNPGKTPETSDGVIFELEPIKTSSRKGEISLITIPDNAIVGFDNQEKTFSPLQLKEVDVGNHEIEVTLPSYNIQKHIINVVAQHRLHISVKLSQATELDSQLKSVTDDNDASIDNPNEASLSAKLDEQNSQASTSGIVNSGPRVKILATGFTKDGHEVLKVRSEPKTNAAEIGFVLVGKSYRYLGETKDGWHKIEFKTDDSLMPTPTPSKKKTISVTQELKTGWVNEKFTELIAK